MNRTHIKLAAAALLTAAAAGGAFLFLGQQGAPLRERVARLAVKDKPTMMRWPVAIGEVAGGFADPFGVVLDRAGNAYVADAGDHNQIRKIAPDGTLSVLAGGAEGFADGTGAQAAFNTPSGMAIDGQGNLLVADTANNAIRKISPQGVVTTVAGDGSAGDADGPAAQARFNGPVGVALDKAGNVYVADTYNDRIRRIGTDGMVTTVAGSVPGGQDGAAAVATFDTPVALAVDARGAIYVADARMGAIRRIGADGMVSTLALSDPEADDALLRRPLSLALTHDGFLYVGDMARGRILQLAPTGQLGGLTGIGIDIRIGDAQATRFARPAGIALGADGALYVTDAVQRVLRKVAPRTASAAPAAPRPVSAPAAVALPAPASFPWPLAPQNARHEVVGIIGEARGSYDGESRHHFHNGLDVQGNMGVQVLAVASEKVSSPLPNWGYGDLGEGIALDSFAYYHLRVGRDIKNAPLDTARFALLAGADGKTERVRIKRGTRFKVGDALGTVNRMFHVHLVHRTPKGEANPLALPFPGLEDNVIPRIDSIALHDAADARLTAREGKRLLVPRGAGPLSIVVDAYDQTDGNAARRKLGLYKAGYQILAADGTPLPGFETARMNIEFNQLPPDRESVQVAYANGSGITVYGNKTTRFLYVVTNRVRDGAAAQGSWDPATLPAGDYIIRISASDYAGNEALAGRDLAIAVR